MWSVMPTLDEYDEWHLNKWRNIRDFMGVNDAFIGCSCMLQPQSMSTQKLPSIDFK